MILRWEAADFRRFSQAGRKLARWHFGFESVEPWPVAEPTAALAPDPAKDFLVRQMTFAGVASDGVCVYPANSRHRGT